MSSITVNIPKKVNWPSLWPYLPALIIFTLCLDPLPQAFLPTAGSDPRGAEVLKAAALYHFTHASAWHLLANAAALFLFRPRWGTVIVAFISASLAATSPLTWLALPTCGLSGLLCACFARTYAEKHINPLRFILPNLLFIVFPNFNYRIHILAFGIAYVIWLAILKIKAYRKSGL